MLTRILSSVIGSPTSFFQSAPEIIKAASKDKYSLIAFCILTLGFIAYIYFRNSTAVWVKLVVFLVLFCGCFGLAIAMARSAQQLTYVGQVVDAQTGRPVANAKVGLELDQTTMTDHSDSEGVYAFRMTAKDAEIDGRLTITADNYPSYDRHVHIGFYSGVSQVRLTAVTPVVVNIVLTPLADQQVDKSSGMKLSGVGEAFSDWYELCSGPAPQGYTYRESRYWLTGDRECGKWAECRYARADDSNVCLEFRLQGHNERGLSEAKLSEGHVLVTYKPLGQ